VPSCSYLILPLYYCYNGTYLDVSIKDNLPWLLLKPLKAMVSHAPMVKHKLIAASGKTMKLSWKLIQQTFAHSHVGMLRALRHKVMGMHVEDDKGEGDDGIEHCIGCGLTGQEQASTLP